MHPIRIEEVQDLTSYEKARTEVRTRAIRLRSERRVQAGPNLSLVFENRTTVLYQIQEMVRAERLVEPTAITHELETYNAILPGRNELAATLFIEVADPTQVRADLERFLGLDRGEHLWFELGTLTNAVRVVAEFEQGHSEATRIAAVHYVRFRFGESAVAHFRDLTQPLVVVAEHPNYSYRGDVALLTRRSLIEDLEA